MHQRQRIREAAKAQLLNKTSAADKVYETRVIPMLQLKLPAVSVYTLSDSVNESSDSEHTRELDLVIEAYVAAGNNVDDAIDTLCEQIENAIDDDATLNGTCQEALLSSSDLEVFEEGSKLIGFARLTYSVVYRTDRGGELGPLDNFDTASIKYSLNGTQADADRSKLLVDDIYQGE